MSPTAPIATGSDVSGTIVFRIGGSAANVARSFAVLGGEAAFVGAVGSDALGRRLVEGLRDAGVTPHLALVDGASTARIAVMLGAGGERSFVTARGAAECLGPSDLRRSWFDGIGVLHLPAYSLLGGSLGDAAAMAAAWAHEAGAMVSVDLASAAPLRAIGAEGARVAVATVRPDVLFANAEEAAVLEDRLADLAATVVIKMGADGCRVGDVVVPTEAVEADDTTGAGDAFDAGFLFALLNQLGASPADAGRAGNAAARALLTTARAELDL